MSLPTQEYRPPSAFLMSSDPGLILESNNEATRMAETQNKYIAISRKAAEQDLKRTRLK